MFSEKIITNLGKSSWIRAMFEEGEKLRKIYGPEHVFDFSLGNPDPEPPVKVKSALKQIILEDPPRLHGYMPNAGYPDVRAKIASSLQETAGVTLSGQHIVMTCGAGGALNVILKTLLNPGEEVVVLSPFLWSI